ncbi:uncharacterized protein Fot_49382 [Forsythia ovata]|uniref:C3H1-type domain-containing protein n=1 Tax=Forsythia ovata TaxID=205694 RepID=A0ABD1QBQ3_9LAMI
MPSSSSSAAVVDPLPAARQPLSSEIDDDVEMECEEVEVEEEDDNDFGEDLTPIRDENHQNDSSGVTGPEEHLRSGLVTPGKHVADSLPNVPTILDNTGKLNIFESSEDRPKTESYADGKRTPKNCDEKVPVCDSRGMNALNTKASVGVVIAATSMVDASSSEKVNGVEYFAAENIKEMSQRLYVSQIRPRDLSSSNELTDGNKRQRIICEFHAKGWCIKGNSCRFLHIKEGAVDASKQKLFSSSTQYTTGYLTNASSDDWEPSAPFRPSHIVTQELLSRTNLYDPIRDSVEPTNIRDGVSNISGGGKGASVPSPHLQSNDLHSTGDNDPKVNISSSNRDSKQGEPMHKTDPEVDEVRLKNENDIDFKTNLYVQKESKAMRHFQAVLVEYVKDLVKPTWLDGLLSKEAHKVIVKKAVDKVLSSFQPHQIPSTGESIKSYLSVSRPKLEKLVEGYIEKYGKS